MAGIEAANQCVHARNPPNATIEGLQSFLPCKLLIQAMETTRVSTNGQIVIPTAVREALQWWAGKELVVLQTEDGVLLKAASAAPRRLPTEEQIRAIVAEKGAGRFSRSVGSGEVTQPG
jgi:AbrB family looped-hinge helix DNA binding protein